TRDCCGSAHASGEKVDGTTTSTRMKRLAASRHGHQSSCNSLWSGSRCAGRWPSAQRSRGPGWAVRACVGARRGRAARGCEGCKAGARLMVIKKGEVVVTADIAADATPPIPPGCARSLTARREVFTLACFDRLRALITELKRLVVAGAPVMLRFGAAPPLRDA